MIVGGIVFGLFLGILFLLIVVMLVFLCLFLLVCWLGCDLLLKYVGYSNIFQVIEKGIVCNGIDFFILICLILLFFYNI